MSDKLLKCLLGGQTSPEDVLKWLFSDNSSETGFSCTKWEFVSCFLNFIHDELACPKEESAQTLAVTPKRIEHTSKHTQNSTTFTRKRSALFSTPKQDANDSLLGCTPLKEVSKNTSYMSPVSPLYVKKPSSTPSKLCLMDFITPDKQKKGQEGSGKKKKTRRINPTSITGQNSGFRKKDNSFCFENDEIVVSISSEEQRTLLAEERAKIACSGIASATVFKPAPALVTQIDHDITLVTNVDIVAGLAKVYGSFLRQNVVVNVTTEIYFLISILVSAGNTKPDSQADIFRNVHNRVYFASKSLALQGDFLQILDRHTLKLLTENYALKLYASDLIGPLQAAYKNKTAVSPIKPDRCSQSNVCFISDTDNRDNFPNDASFHAFRKQRDLFYDVLRVWEVHHGQTGWSYAAALGGKIKALLNMHNEPANYVHFSRLFKGQLLMNSLSDGEDNEVILEGQLSFLNNIPNVNAEKLSRLKSRLVTKQTSVGINSPPTFAGHQEFYRDFLEVTAGHVFCRHLADTLISNVVAECNVSPDADDENMVIDSNIDVSYGASIRSLRVLAKFLGFLESMPYRSEVVNMPDCVAKAQIQIRNSIKPSFDIEQILNRSIKSGNLIQTVPWLTEYLAMLDPIALRLSHCRSVLLSLFEISILTPPATAATSNIYLSKLCLGWLFELPHFPRDLYYDWLSQKFARNGSGRSGHGGGSSKRSPDDLVVVSQDILYACCPYLEQIKALLSASARNSSGSGLCVKHITPTTAVGSCEESAYKKLQLQLQEAFFNSQSVSVRKTIEFISERVASACVKHVCAELVPGFKKRRLAEFQSKLKSMRTDYESDSEYEAVMKALSDLSKDFAETCLADLKVFLSDELEGIKRKRISTSVGSLLALDVLPQVGDVCEAVSSRICSEMIQQWVDSHTNSSIFKKDFDAEIKSVRSLKGRESGEKLALLLPPFGKDVSHDEDACSGSEILCEIRSRCWDLLENTPFPISEVESLLQRTGTSIKRRCDLNDCLLVLILKLLLDLLFLLLAHKPDEVNRTHINSFVCTWSEADANSRESLFDTVICARNVAILGKSQSHQSWSLLSDFVVALIRAGLMTFESLESQWVSIYKTDWNQETASRLTDCLQSITNGVKRLEGDVEVNPRW